MLPFRERKDFLPKYRKMILYLRSTKMEGTFMNGIPRLMGFELGLHDQRANDNYTELKSPGKSSDNSKSYSPRLPSKSFKTTLQFNFVFLLC